MANRKGVFIGAYVPTVLKRDLAAAARKEFRTVSQEVTMRLAISVYGTAEIPGATGPRKDGRARPKGAKKEAGRGAKQR